MRADHRKSNALTALQWLGTVTGLGGALSIALNLSWSGWGFAIFLVSSVAWTAAAWAMRNVPLLLLSMGYTAINLLGIYRWLIG